MAWHRIGITETIIWTNVDQIHWCIYAALGGDELKKYIFSDTLLITPLLKGVWNILLMDVNCSTINNTATMPVTLRISYFDKYGWWYI